MSLRPHGHARVNARSPEAFGKCDRCGFLYNLVDLRFQREWAGAKLINRRLRVCSSCMDRAQPQLRERRLTQDPVPVRDPRPLNNLAVMGGYAKVTRVPVSGAPAYGAEFTAEFDQATQAIGYSPQLVVVLPSQDIYAAPAQFDPEFVSRDFDRSSYATGYDSSEEEGNLPVSIDPT